jgi:hypothetical protein
MSLNSLTKLLVIILLPLLFTAVSCNKPTEPNTGNVTIAVEDASCTEVWLKITAGSNAIVQDYILYENDNKKLDITLKQRDTVITIENLLPKHNYRYKLMNPNNVSNEALAITLDTTSHNFNWQVFEFGQSGSVFRDAFIIDENNIWVVGEVNIYNPADGTIDIYNAAHWDGTDWELKKINVVFLGNTITPPLDGIYVFNENDMWFGCSLPMHWDGERWNLYDIRTTISPELSITKIVGLNSKELYFVGGNGTIVYYTDTYWRRIFSGTMIQFSDIILFNNRDVYTIGSNRNEPPWNPTLLKITGTTVKKIEIEGTDLPLIRMWGKSEKKVYLGGAGLYQGAITGGKINVKQIAKETIDWWLYGINGTDYNDIFVVGSFGWVVHFNGMNWKKIPNEEIQEFNGTWNWVTANEKIVCAVGSEGPGKAKILLGRRIN